MRSQFLWEEGLKRKKDEEQVGFISALWRSKENSDVKGINKFMPLEISFSSGYQIADLIFYLL